MAAVVKSGNASRRGKRISFTEYGYIWPYCVAYGTLRAWVACMVASALGAQLQCDVMQVQVQVQSLNIGAFSCTDYHRVLFQ